MPDFPEHVDLANTEEEAVALARERITLELERLREWSEAVPTESDPPKVLQVAP